VLHFTSQSLMLTRPGNDNAIACSIFLLKICHFCSRLLYLTHLWKKLWLVRTSNYPDVEVKKRNMLIPFCRLRYFFIEDRLSYRGYAVLKSVSIRQKHIVFARHLLAKSKQQPGESFQAFQTIDLSEVWLGNNIVKVFCVMPYMV